jgi:hypothetical protein
MHLEEKERTRWSAESLLNAPSTAFTPTLVSQQSLTSIALSSVHTATPAFLLQGSTVLILQDAYHKPQSDERRGSATQCPHTSKQRARKRGLCDKEDSST